MSLSSYFAIIPVVVLHDKLLKPIEKVIYAELSSHIGTGKFCIIELSKLCEMYECTENTMNTYLSSLEKRGYVKAETYKDKLRIAIKY